MSDRKLNDLAEKISQSFHEISDLYHKLADSGDLPYNAKESTELQKELAIKIDAKAEEIDQVMQETKRVIDSHNYPGDNSLPVVEQPTEPENNGGPPVEIPDAVLPGPIVESSPREELELSDVCWLGSWYADVWHAVKEVVRKANGKPNVFVAYNVVNRDNGNYSAGGLKTAQEYWDWSGKIAAAIGDSVAYVILEPDALGLFDGLSPQQKAERYDCLLGAVVAYNKAPNVKLYVDASVWVQPEEMANRLRPFAGSVDGFSCNVSGYEDHKKVMLWGEEVSRLTGMHYVIDTSRNGNGNPHTGKWCNVTDTKVGILPTIKTASKFCDAYLWCKDATESDGLGINDDGTNPRNDVPKAGEKFPDFSKAIFSGDWKEFKEKYKV